MVECLRLGEGWYGRVAYLCAGVGVDTGCRASERVRADGCLARPGLDCSARVWLLASAEDAGLSGSGSRPDRGQDFDSLSQDPNSEPIHPRAAHDPHPSFIAACNSSLTGSSKPPSRSPCQDARHHALPTARRLELEVPLGLVPHPQARARVHLPLSVSNLAPLSQKRSWHARAR